METKLKIFHLYDHPDDYPDFYVVKSVTIEAGNVIPDRQPYMKSVSLEKIQDELEWQGLVVLPRDENDDPKLICSYI